MATKFAPDVQAFEKAHSKYLEEQLARATDLKRKEQASLLADISHVTYLPHFYGLVKGVYADTLRDNLIPVVTTRLENGDVDMEIKGDVSATPFYNIHYQSLLQDLPVLLQRVVQLQRSKVTALHAKQTRKKEIKEQADVEMDDDMLSTKSIRTIIAKEIARVAKTGKDPKGKGPKGGNKSKPKKGSTKVDRKSVV